MFSLFFWKSQRKFFPLPHPGLAEQAELRLQRRGRIALAGRAFIFLLLLAGSVFLTREERGMFLLAAGGYAVWSLGRKHRRKRRPGDDDFGGSGEAGVPAPLLPNTPVLAGEAYKTFDQEKENR